MKTSIALVEAGHEVTVVALHRNQLPRWNTTRRDFASNGAHLHPWISGVGPFKWAELVLRIAWVYRKADAWHCNDAEAFGIGLLAKSAVESQACV